MTSKSSVPLYYRQHLFFCTNERPADHVRGSCKVRGSEKLRNYMKARAKELGLDDTRINTAGCLDRCENGPVVVVYPEGVWYQCTTAEEAEQILQQHVKQGKIVDHLMLQPRDQESAKS
ncbi:MAG TPA: (2Fe-2S) ferredoxin domain-containing protein [Alphaproteobacteria bacterium]|jgi:(2Fe-2S) ferredoxin|nr:(2Fe-2S) ferredoxin domain-containing protein [Alphaproteobacteria bacterium]HMS44293.1 (2Fe-2S) ferredoxin domain-containing protein [Alphaproteobacteria bacterium]